jgi:hypothetical protein
MKNLLAAIEEIPPKANDFRLLNAYDAVLDALPQETRPSDSYAVAVHSDGTVTDMHQSLSVVSETTAPVDRNAIIEECAGVCEKRVERRFNAVGTREPITGATYYSGRDKGELEAKDEEDEDCAAAIRALKNAAPQVPDGAGLKSDVTPTPEPAVAAPSGPSAETAAPVEQFVVKHYVDNDFPCIKGNGFDGLQIGENREEAETFIRWINERLSAPSAPIINQLESSPDVGHLLTAKRLWSFNSSGGSMTQESFLKIVTPLLAVSGCVITERASVPSAAVAPVGDTPRVDAYIKEHTRYGGGIVAEPKEIPASFARQLERELAAAITKNQEEIEADRAMTLALALSEAQSSAILTPDLDALRIAANWHEMQAKYEQECRGDESAQAGFHEDVARLLRRLGGISDSRGADQ